MITQISFFDSVIVTIFSMIVVFLCLIAIAAIINRIKVLSADRKKSNVNKPADAVDVNDIGKFDNTVSATENHNNANEDINQEELVAVIAAAIASSLGVGIPDINIQTIRRIPQGTSPWSDMGRKEQLLGKL